MYYGKKCMFSSKLYSSMNYSAVGSEFILMKKKEHTINKMSLDRNTCKTNFSIEWSIKNVIIGSQAPDLIFPLGASDSFSVC